MSDLIINPHALAKVGECSYSGDIHPIDYSGFWYSTKEWDANGYADAVEVDCLEDGPDGAKHVIVTRCTINRPSPERMARAFKSCGIEDAASMTSAHCAIECVKRACGTEPNDSDWREFNRKAFIVINDDQDVEDFAYYARIHLAHVVTSEDPIWELLATWVGKESCQ